MIKGKIKPDEIARHRCEVQEAMELDEAERLKREKTRPPKHDKLRGPYGKRK